MVAKKAAPKPEPEGTDCLKLHPDKPKLTCPGDPVKLAGRTGYYRYTKKLTDTVAEVVGPYYPSNPKRTQEVTRVQVIVNLKPAPTSVSRAAVQMSPAAAALSNDAKRKK